MTDGRVRHADRQRKPSIIDGRSGTVVMVSIEQDDSAASSELPVRSSKRKVRIPSLPISMKSLFFSNSGVARGKDTVLKRHGKRWKVLSTEPNIFLIENFLSERELQYFDEQTKLKMRNFLSSYTEDEDGNRVLDERRTSTFVWFQKRGSNILKQVERRAAEMVGTHPNNVEPFQIVAYKNGQEFKAHHDMGTLDEESGAVEASDPRRLVTFFVYLNTLPEGQGHTEFPSLNLSVKPERGTALCFPNVLVNGEPDTTTVHCAKPVSDGYTKFGMNVWITGSDLQDMADVAPARKKAKKTREIRSKSVDISV